MCLNASCSSRHLFFKCFVWSNTNRLHRLPHVFATNSTFLWFSTQQNILISCFALSDFAVENVLDMLKIVNRKQSDFWAVRKFSKYLRTTALKKIAEMNPQTKITIKEIQRQPENQENLQIFRNPAGKKYYLIHEILTLSRHKFFRQIRLLIFNVHFGIEIFSSPILILSAALFGDGDCPLMMVSFLYFLFLVSHLLEEILDKTFVTNKNFGKFSQN